MSLLMLNGSMIFCIWNVGMVEGHVFFDVVNGCTDTHGGRRIEEIVRNEAFKTKKQKRVESQRKWRSEKEQEYSTLGKGLK